MYNQKYIKYKTKYLQLKAKLLQSGGGTLKKHDRNNAGGREDTLLRANPKNDDDWALDSSSKKIVLNKGDVVEVLQTQTDPQSKINFSFVKTISGSNGWVNNAYLIATPVIANPNKTYKHDRYNSGKIETTALRINPNNSSQEQDFAKDASGNKIILHKGEEVKVLSTNFDQVSNKAFAQVIKNGVSGWVNTDYLEEIKSSHVGHVAHTPSPPLPSPTLPIGLMVPFLAPGPGAVLPPPVAPTPVAKVTPDSIDQFIANSKKNIGQEFKTHFFVTLNNPTFLNINPVDDKKYLPDGSGFFKTQNDTKGLLMAIQTDSTGKTFGKISIKIPSGAFIVGWFDITNLKKANWGCSHSDCNSFGYNIPSSVASILTNIAGQILVSTETNPAVYSAADPTKKTPGYHLCAGKIDPGSCPVISSYDETAEEGRLLPVVKSGSRDFTKWNEMFKPGNKYMIQPWIDKKGSAVVFVGNAGTKYWDATNPPYGNSQTFSNPSELTTTFATLRGNKSFDSKYREKIDFKWVTPLAKRSSDSDWDKWSITNNMYPWATNLIREYVEKK